MFANTVCFSFFRVISYVVDEFQQLFLGPFFRRLWHKSLTHRPLKIAVLWCKNDDFHKLTIFRNSMRKCKKMNKKCCQTYLEIIAKKILKYHRKTPKIRSKVDPKQRFDR